MSDKGYLFIEEGDPTVHVVGPDGEAAPLDHLLMLGHEFYPSGRCRFDVEVIDDTEKGIAQARALSDALGALVVVQPIYIYPRQEGRGTT